MCLFYFGTVTYNTTRNKGTFNAIIRFDIDYNNLKDRIETDIKSENCVAHVYRNTA